MAVTGKTKEELKLAYGKSYLIKYATIISEVNVLQITEKCYKLKFYRSDDTTYNDWIEKNEFDRKYLILEELPPRYESSTDYKKGKFNYNNAIDNLIGTCPVCGGDGKIPDDKTTAGSKPCPKCFGSGNILKS